MKPKNVLVVHYEPYGALEEVERVLKQHNIPVISIERSELTHEHAVGKDLVISVGGDGTFLVAARHVSDAFIIGVNSNPEDKEGFLTRATAETFEERFHAILDDKFTALYLTRLQPTLEGKDLPLVLNEVFIGHREPHHMAIYTLKAGEKEEQLQKSSGILVATAVGSNGWLKSARGKVMAFMDRGFQFLVRDPFSGRIVKSTLTEGMLKEGETLSIGCTMDKGIISLDGGPRHEFPNGSTLKITTSDKRLKFIDFPE